VCNPLINLAYYCGGEKILLPLGFSIAGAGERPRCPRGSDAFGAVSNNFKDT